MCTIDNDIYNKLGSRWYTAFDDPVAILRAETELTNPWIISILERTFAKDCAILDVGCGGGFHTNKLSNAGFSNVSGIDLSAQSIDVAKEFNTGLKVKYYVGDAYHLPFPDNSFDAVISIDFLEHVDKPEAIIQEVNRVLKKEGLFFFHTFNRNWLSWLVIIKFVEWFVANTPKNLHVLHLFIKPSELSQYLKNAGFNVLKMRGTRVNFFRWSVLKTVLSRSGEVPKDFSFSFTSSLLLSYIGYGRKN